MVEALSEPKVDPNKVVIQYKSTPDGALAHQEKSPISH